MNLILTMIITYLIGCFSSAYIIGKFIKEIDIREHGSGNSGSTNALRVMGLKMGVLTFIFDVLKGVLSSYIGFKILGDNGKLIGGFFAVVGHNWPIFLGFKGGKGVATTMGVFLTISWSSAIIAVIVGLLIAFISKFVSLGSMCFLVSFPVVYLIKGILLKEEINKNYIIFAIIMAIMSIYRHKANIQRIIAGNENKIGR